MIPKKRMWQSNFLFQLVLGYLIVLALVYFISDYFIFYKFPASYQDHAINTIKLKTEDGKTISAVYLPNPSAHFTILFSHGNAEDLGHLLPFFNQYRNHGFSIFGYDYHGYGTSEGTPSEKNTYMDIVAAYRYMTTHLNISPERIILHGRSIGTGPTIELATRYPNRALILESPMVSAFQVLTVVPLFPLDRYRNLQKISEIEVPVLFIHGTEDTIIPPWHSKRLYEEVRGEKAIVMIEGAGHNDILLKGETVYWNAILQFSQSLLSQGY